MKKLLLCLITAFASAITYSQQVLIKGSVTDEKGDGLQSVSIIVKNKPTLHATTNDKGIFEIRVEDPVNDVLVFSHIGYTNQELRVNNQLLVKVQLAADQTKSEEIVVVSALGINRAQKTLTYASQNVDPKTLTEARDVNFMNGLAGKIAGLQVTGTGQPGGSVRLTLRGDNSLSGSNQPLIVVDGVPIENNPGDAGNIDYGNAVANINPDDIETITVLKGPNGAALYGAKAANGAILITLKKGKTGGDGTLGIDVNQNFQFYKITAFPEYQNVYGEGSNMRLSGENVNNVNQANGGVNMGTSNQSWGAPMLGQPYNSYAGIPIEGGYAPQASNVSDLYQPSFTNSSNISISRSDAASAFRLSYGFTKSNDVIENLNLIKKHNLTLTASRIIGTKIRIDTRIGYTYWDTKNRMLKNLDASNPLSTYVYMARSVRLDGFLPYEDANGNAVATGQVNNTENPYWSIYSNSNRDTRNALNGAVIATVNLAPDLKIRGQVVGDLATTENYMYRELGGRTNPLGSYSNSINRQNNWFYELLATYTKRIGSDFVVDALAGASVNDVNVLGRAASINSLLVHDMPSIGNANTIPVATEFLTRSKQQSAFGKLSVGFRDFVYLDVTARNEWSSTLPLGSNSFFYPSIGGNFIFTEFIRENNILSSGKLRVNYARVGNSTQPYQLLNTYSPQGLYMGNPYLAYTNQLKNADLKPEQQVSKEIGLDLSLFKNRLNLSTTYYDNSTINQIVNVQTAYETGFNNRVVNAGEIQNRGFELTLSATPYQTKKFSWRSIINFATNKSEVVSLLPNVNRIQLGGRLGMTVNALVGQPYGTHIGIQPYHVGDTILVATSGRNIPEPNVITGNPRPQFTGGFSNSFSYEGFSLSVTATVRWGGVVFSESYGRAMFQGTTAKSLEGRDDYFFSNFILGESDEERRNIGGQVGPGRTRYLDSNRVKGLQYANAYLAQTGPGGVLLIDPKTGRYMVGDRSVGWVYPQLVLGNDKTTNDVPYLTFDASSIRISEIVFGYTLPKKWLNQGFVKGAFVAVTGRNVWQIYQKTPIGIDPEAAAGSTNGTLGIESGGSFPYAILGFTLKLSF
ncbi:SusC/RagA family TonB-linked outer membrane protein [Flavitalea sp.]|nr:SusC/RagA family TonB-linked outer membrane protein [Flavitalea sp.]